MTIREVVPEAVKSYLRLLSAKLRYPDCSVGTPLVGKRVRLGRGCTLSRDVELSDGVSIGDYSYVNRGSLIASGEIGRFCSIGPYTLIGQPEHPTNYLSTSPKLYGSGNIFGTAPQWEDSAAPPRICSDVWIGAQAFVRRDVQIGPGAIIAAGAVVVHNVSPFAIVGGVPAKLIRYRFDAETITSLLKSRWWDRDPAELSEVQESFWKPLAPIREELDSDPILRANR